MNRRKSILFIFQTTELNNGGVRSMVDIVETLITKYQIQATVVYSEVRGTAIDYLEELGVHCYHVPFGYWNYSMDDSIYRKCRRFAKIILGYIQTKNCMKIFSDIIKKESIDLVYTNTAIMYVGAWISKAFNLPHIWHIREFLQEDHEYAILFGNERLYRKMNEADVVLYISESIRGKYSKYLDKDTKQLIIYDDISPDYINPKKSFDLNPDRPLQILIAGILQKGKGQLEVIQAVELLKKRGKDVCLHIAGKPTGAYYEELKKYVKDHDLEEIVSFDGFILDMNTYRSKMDIAVVASSNEAFGRVTVEGMLSMLCVIGADAAGTAELITDGKSGLLYTLGDIEQLAEQIQYLQENPSRMVQLAEDGFNIARDTFTVGKGAETINRLMDELIQAKRGRV